jgi:hypothetical protein
MPSEQSAGYLPGDPRYGLQGEALKDYYRTKPGQRLPARRNPPLVEQFPDRATDYVRKGLQQFLCTGPKTGTPDGVLPRAPARARIIRRVVWRQFHLPRANPLGGWCGQYRHSIADRVDEPRGCGQVLA